jgi:DNA polymerase
LKVFAEKGDPYKMAAARIYGKPEKEITKDERFMGKQVTLGAGYGMGADKFQRMLDDTYDIEIDVPFAFRVINTYREANRAITGLWRRLGEAAKHVVMLKKEDVAVTSNIRMGMTTVGQLPYLWIQIPSGRRLYYCEPVMVGDNLEYWGRNPYKGGKWDRVHGYGGKFAENITQALSRDLMADAMLRLEAEGFKLVATIHDEVVAEGSEGLEQFKKTMRVSPPWAAGLPLDVEVFTCKRYRK